jgi:serine/threonine protein kinase
MQACAWVACRFPGCCLPLGLLTRQLCLIDFGFAKNDDDLRTPLCSMGYVPPEVRGPACSCDSLVRTDTRTIFGTIFFFVVFPRRSQAVKIILAGRVYRERYLVP